MAGEIALDCMLNIESVPANGEPRLVYMLVDVKPGKGAKPLEAPVNLVVVLDVSESMRLPVLTQEHFQELKKLGQVEEVISDGVPVWTFKSIPDHIRRRAPSNLEAVQRAIAKSTTYLDDDDRISLIAFADRSQPLVSGLPGAERGQILETIAAMGALNLGDGTDMATGLGVGIVEARRNAAPNMLNRLLVLTDGFTREPDRVKRLAAEARAAGITISTLGIGSEFNEKLLVELADSSLGNAYFARAPQEIPLAFGQEMSAVQSVVMRGVQVETSFSAGVELRRAYRVRPSISTVQDAPREGRLVKFNMGDLDPENPPALLLELIVPSCAVGNFRIAHIAVVNQESNKDRIVRGNCDVVLNYSASVKREEPNPLVMNTVEKVTAFALQTRALEDVAMGNMLGATKKLRAAATRLLKMGEIALAEAAENEASRLETTGEVSPEGVKELHYATRKLTQRLVDGFARTEDSDTLAGNGS